MLYFVYVAPFSRIAFVTFAGDIGKSVVHSDSAVDRIGNCCRRRHDRHFADPANADRMTRVRHLNQDRLYHR